MYYVTCTACNTPGIENILTRERAQTYGDLHRQAHGCDPGAIEVTEQ